METIGKCLDVGCSNKSHTRGFCKRHYYEYLGTEILPRLRAPRGSVKHGDASMYKSGCRCTDCTEAHVEYGKIWKQANLNRWKESHNRAVRKWKSRNQERVLEDVVNRRARLRGASGSHTAKEFAELKRLCGDRCVKCGVHDSASKLHRDHVIPISWGGSNDIENIQPMCLRCNSTKGNSEAVDYVPHR